MQFQDGSSALEQLAIRPSRAFNPDWHESARFQPPSNDQKNSLSWNIIMGNGSSGNSCSRWFAANKCGFEARGLCGQKKNRGKRLWRFPRLKGKTTKTGALDYS
jgi:hypothetical protein